MSGDELLALGLDRWAVRRRVAKGILWPIQPGVFAFGTPDISRRGEMRAAFLTCRRKALVSHAAGTELWELIDKRAAPVDVLVAGGQPRRKRVRVHRTNWLPDDHRTIWHGLPVTTVERTLLDAATCLPPAQLELAVAGALRRQLTTVDALTSLAATTRSGSRALTATLTLAGGPQFTRSEAERILLRLIRDARLPPPDANRYVFGEERDLVWHEQQVVVEFDGFGFHWSPESKQNDARRDGELTVRGWRTIRITWRELTEDQVAVTARLAGTLAIPPMVRTSA